MEITLLFLVTVTAFTALLVYNYRAAFMAAIFLYAIYPRFFALGVSGDGFALTAQRAMLLLLLGMYVLRSLWGSAEIRQGIETTFRHKAVFIALTIYLGARLVGNVLTGQFGIGALAQLTGQTLISLVIMVLAITYVRTREGILTLLTLVMLSLLFNQFLTVYEFARQETIFPESISLQYEAGGKGEDLLEGRTRDDAYRAMGVFDNPLKLAAFLIMMLPINAFLFRFGRSTLVKVLAGTSVVMALPTALFTGSRAALGMALLIFTWWVYRWLARGLTRPGRFFLGFCGILIGGALLIGVGSGVLQEFLFGAAYARSTEARYLAYIQVPLMLLDNPLFGFGYSRNIVEQLGMAALDPFYLRLALEGGVITVAAFLYFLWRAGKLLQPVAAAESNSFDASLARALRLSIGVTAILASVLTISYVRMYLFLFVGVGMVLIDLWQQNQQMSRQRDQGQSAT